MSILALTGLVNFTTSLFAGIFILIKNPRETTSRLFFMVNISISLYSLGYFFWQISSTIATATTWFHVLTIGIILIQITFLHFVFSFTEILEKKRKEIFVYYLINATFIVLSVVPGFFYNLEPRFNLGYWPVARPIFHIYLVFWTWQCVYGLYWLIKGVMKFSGIRSEQIKFIIISAIIGFIGGASNWFIWYKINIPPYANILISIYVGIFLFAIIRHGFLNIRIVLTHASLFVVLYSIILVVPLIIAQFTGYGIIPFLILFILAIFGNFFYRYLQQKADELLSARQNQYNSLLYNASQSIVRERNLERVLRIIVIGIKRLLKVSYVKLYLDDPESSSYKLRSMLPREQDVIFSEYNYEDPVIEIIKDYKRAITGLEIKRYTTFESDDIILIVPFIIDDHLLGFVAIGDHDKKMTFSIDELKLSEIMAYHASLAIENCLYVSEIKDVQEKLFLAEKKSFIAGMAEGVAHQINNRLNYFSLSSAELNMIIDQFAKQYPQLSLENPVKNMITTIKNIGDNLIENVRRTSNIIRGVINYSNIAKEDSKIIGISFKDLVDEALNLVRINHDTDTIPVQIEIKSSVPVFGIKSQLIEVLFNLLDNSYDSIEMKSNYLKSIKSDILFNPFIKITITGYNKTHSSIELEDNGIGIKDEDKNKIFAPYYSSKSTALSKLNSGLGMYSVNRIIEENHSGKIWFNSTYMEGTTFYIRLPIPDNH